MEVVTKNWNTDENYWQMNPIMKTFEIFKKLYLKDKSKGKAHSSLLMWAIALLVDPSEENPWRNLPEDEKKLLISGDFLKINNFNWEDSEIVDLISFYEYIGLTKSERHLKQLEEKALERGRFIMQTPYSLDSFDEETNKIIKGTFNQLDSMLTNSLKVFQQIDQIKVLITKEKIEGVGKGGAVESLSEKGQL